MIVEKVRMKQINLKLTEKQHKDLEDLSLALGDVTKSNLIRIAIAEYIIKYRSLFQED
jgi:metal-responsive CopG/Arc/MetJ family transcriptional regulator